MRIKVRVDIVKLLAIMLLTFFVTASVATPAYANVRQMEPLDFTNSNTPTFGPGFSWDEQNKTLTLGGLEMDLKGCSNDFKAGITLTEGSTIFLSDSKYNASSWKSVTFKVKVQ